MCFHDGKLLVIHVSMHPVVVKGWGARFGSSNFNMPQPRQRSHVFRLAGKR